MSGVSAAEALSSSLRRWLDDLRSAESDVRLDVPAAVHDFRIAARRLRSVLRPTDALFTSRPELVGWLGNAGRAAGPTRDSDVLRGRLVHALADEPAGTTVLLLRERLDRELEGQRRRQWLELVDYLDSPAYDALVRRLDGFTDITPWSALAGKPASQVLPPIVDAEQREFDTMTARLVQRSPDDDLDEALHDLRKRAKSVRYLTDALIPSLGRPAKKVRKSMRRVQTILGDLGDTQLMARFLAGRVDRPDLDRSERKMLQRVQAREVARVNYLRSEFLGSLQAPDRRLSAT